MTFFRSPLSIGMGLLLTPLFSCAENNTLQKQDSKKTLNISSWKMPRYKQKNILDIGIQIKTESFSLHNKNLRRDEKRENEMKWGPQVRLDSWIMKDSPVYGKVELEWQRKIKRKSGVSPDKKNHLEINQAYLGLTETIIPLSHIQLGRWLYRDEREWLFDENFDGVVVRNRIEKWRIDTLGGRVNYWQRDLLDRASRNEGANNIAGLFIRRKLIDDVTAGAYIIAQSTPEKGFKRQKNIGLRSYSQNKKALRHWLDLGLSDVSRAGKNTRGYAVDVGGTYIFNNTELKPRITMGYAMGTQYYRQTGLHDNEATFGGNTKFKFYGETLNPDLSNIQIMTTGLGINLPQQATLDVVYHDYRQARLMNLSQNRIDLKAKHDKKTTRRLGSGVDIIVGWEPVDNTKLEARLGMFAPSKRLASSTKENSSRSDNAYSAGIEIALRF
ncbi:TPA: alginate export family protein [Serratia marcescens]